MRPCSAVGKLKHRETKWPSDVIVQDEVITAKSRGSLGLVKARGAWRNKACHLFLGPLGKYAIPTGKVVFSLKNT